MKKLLLFFSFQLIFNALAGQTSDTLPRKQAFPAGISIEMGAHLGRVVRHTPKIFIGTGQTNLGQEIGLRFSTDGRRAWHHMQRFPVWGLAFCHFRLGESAHGDAFALVPNLTVPIFRRPRWAATFRLGTGVAYVTKPYDYFKNPGQNAIGSHWNNAAQFRLGAEAKLGGHWRALGGFSFTHFSNGGSALPNFGINIPAGYFSLAYSPVKEAFKKALPQNRRPEKRFGATAQVGGAYVEYIVFDGPRYPVWTASAAGIYAFNRINRMHIGLDYEFNRAVYAWGLYTTAFDTEGVARRSATRLAVFAADEFLFGHCGVQLQAGFYAGNTFNQYVLTRFYSKLIVRGYLPRLFGTSLRPHVGICLKAHKVIAEYISFNAGLEF